MKGLAQDLLGPGGEPAGYVSFLSALVHHGALVDGVACVQVASADRAGPWPVGGGLIEYVLVPRDLWFGWRDVRLEGDLVPMATPEKALLDWCWLAEELGIGTRLAEIEWDSLDLGELDRLARLTGIDYRRSLPPATEPGYDQDRLREEVLARLR